MTIRTTLTFHMYPSGNRGRSRRPFRYERNAKLRILSLSSSRQTSSVNSLPGLRRLIYVFWKGSKRATLHINQLNVSCTFRLIQVQCGHGWMLDCERLLNVILLFHLHSLCRRPQAKINDLNMWSRHRAKEPNFLSVHSYLIDLLLVQMENLPRAGGGDLLVNLISDMSPVITVPRQHEHNLATNSNNKCKGLWRILYRYPCL